MYSIYLKYLRRRIRYCNTSDDIVKLIKNIDFFHKDTTSDKICDILIKCLILYPLTNDELQKFSIFQQQHDGEGGLYNFVTFTLWISSIQSIKEINDIKNNNKINDIENNNKINDNKINDIENEIENIINDIIDDIFRNDDNIFRNDDDIFRNDDDNSNNIIYKYSWNINYIHNLPIINQLFRLKNNDPSNVIIDISQNSYFDIKSYFTYLNK